MESLFSQGITLMVYGMGMVFIFLFLLIMATALLSKLVNCFTAVPLVIVEADNVDEVSPLTLKILQAAVDEHRRQRS